MYRYIPFKHYNPYFKTGLNKALMESVREGNEPLVFLAGWDQKCINLGYSQSFEEEVNDEEFEKREDVVLVRRQGGGGTTFLTPEGEITWGIVAPNTEFPSSVNKVYERVCGKIAKGLKQININAEHEPINDIVTAEGKVSGATLKRKNETTYVGGTLLYDVNVEEMFSLLTPGQDKIKDKKIERHRERISMINKESDASFEETVQALEKALLTDLDYEESKLKSSEVQRAEELADKYSSKDWLYRE